MLENDKRTILTVDDDKDVTLALSKRLGSNGYRCLSAASVTEGLSKFRGERVELIISDLNMPGGDGVAFAETIRKTSDVPIIFITGFRDDFKRRLRGIENVTTLRKPFNTQELMELITATIGEHSTSPLPANIELERP
jgi:DNA-binding response OmpR family regulator